YRDPFNARLRDRYHGTLSQAQTTARFSDRQPTFFRHESCSGTRPSGSLACTADPMTTVYCARWILPMSSAPLLDGAMAISGSEIKAVGARSDLQEQFPGASVYDFGEAAILPGLINAHSHLELTAMRGFLDAEERDFFAWLKKLTRTRAERLSMDDLYVSAAWGACEAARAGITCLGDASDAAGQSMRALRDV